jgi:cytochrome b pre-mRNA-processing protein 3
MLRSLKARSEHRRKAGELYGAIVTQARQPEFYADLGIPDTAACRYELIVLHVFLVLRRLQDDAAAAGELPRTLVEAFVEDMDDSMRELGTGDLGVAKKVRRAAAGLYERSRDYREALAGADNEQLCCVLASHVAAQSDARQIAALAAYVRGGSAMLAGQDMGYLLDGGVAFPPVGTVREMLS